MKLSIVFLTLLRSYKLRLFQHVVVSSVASRFLIGLLATLLATLLYIQAVCSLMKWLLFASFVHTNQSAAQQDYYCNVMDFRCVSQIAENMCTVHVHIHENLKTRSLVDCWCIVAGTYCVGVFISDWVYIFFLFCSWIFFLSCGRKRL